ncbi:DNA translocase FtsK 4TM domain-containing protein [Paracoccaceae bacterium]|nr:DNA translocase FtsK 4TM domain-containing protein [Paracoccaceae bacterium]
MSFLEKVDYPESATKEYSKKFLHFIFLKTLGATLFASSVFILLSIATYSKGDPSFRNANDGEIANFFGIIGSHLADSLHVAIGITMFTLPVFLFSWAIRFLFSNSSSYLIKRMVFLPLFIAFFSVFLSTNSTPYYWSFEYGLGGIFGDTFLKKLLIYQPVEINQWLRLIAALCLTFSILLFFLVAGFNKQEASELIRNRFKHFMILLAGLFKVGRFCVKIIYQSDKKRFKNANYENDSVALSDTGEKNQSYSNTEKSFSATEENEKAALRGFNSRPSISIFGNGRIKARSNKIKSSSRAASEAQPSLDLSLNKERYHYPPLALLSNYIHQSVNSMSSVSLNENAKMLEAVLEDYGVKGNIISVKPGPVVTLYELEPAAGLKASRVISLSEDIARSMSALATRVSTIPGRSVIGIELPNSSREKVFLKELLSSKSYEDCRFQLPLALGKDIGGDPVIANLAKMPHLLIAGTTGSGKSVGINTMILSLLYRLTPEHCRLIMIDPKMLELSVYDGIPHLLSPVVTDPKKAVVALKWAVLEMEDRYKRMSRMGVRNIESFNAKVSEAIQNGETFSRTVQVGFDQNTGEPIYEEQKEEPKALPFIVIIVDEMADLMMVAGKEIEGCIQRLAQMARAAGIHLIMATQRPSVDVITGTIKANFPTRISFQVTSKIDSRTILGEMGAEQLLGMGDMLYMANGGKVTRVHGPFVSDAEVEEIVSHLKRQGVPEYREEILDPKNIENNDSFYDQSTANGNTDEEDLLEDALEIVRRDRKCSTSYIQRKLSIGYNRAAKIVEALEEKGFVSPANHVGKRDVLIPENSI